MIRFRVALLVGTSVALTGCGRVAYELLEHLQAGDAGASTASHSLDGGASSAPDTHTALPSQTIDSPFDAGATSSTTAVTNPATELDASLSEGSDTSGPEPDTSSPTTALSDALSSSSALSNSAALSNSSAPRDASSTSTEASLSNGVTSDASSDPTGGVTSSGGPDVTPSTSTSSSADPSSTSDGDSTSAACATGLFTAPLAVSGLPAPAFSPSLSADGLTLYFASSGDLYTATRTDTDSLAFGQVTALATVNTGNTNELTPSSSRDGLRLYFTRGDDPFRDLYVATRATTADTFGGVSPLGGLNTPSATEVLPRESADGLELYFATLRGATLFDIWVSHRNTLGDSYASPAAVGELNTNSDDNPGGLSSDGLTLMLTSKRPGSLGAQDIWAATRPTTTSAFTEVINEAGVNTTFNDLDPTLSADDRELFFVSDRTGQTLIYRALRCP